VGGGTVGYGRVWYGRVGIFNKEVL